MLPRTILVFCIICLLSACGQLTYYAQAAKGQWQIVSRRQNISELLQDPELSTELKRKLQFAQEIRDFAVDNLDLPDNNTFRTYSNLDRRYVVWNVIATPAYDITPKTWCFPVAGCVNYKGFFSEESANLLNGELGEQDYDTYLYGVTAYSTLGWFSDPILNTFININEIALASLIFHELAHQVIYVKDDSEFNEAFATAVEYAGVERWINLKYADETLAKYQQQRKYNNAITEMVLIHRAKLAGLYVNSSASELPVLKSKTFADMKQSYANFRQQGKGTPFYDWWFSLDLNNAHLSAIATYHRLVPAFLTIFDQSETFSTFYNAVQDQARLPKTDRDKWLVSLDKEYSTVAPDQ